MPGEFYSDQPLTIEDLQMARNNALGAVVRIVNRNSAANTENVGTYGSMASGLLAGMCQAVKVLTAEIERIKAAEETPDPPAYKQPQMPTQGGITQFDEDG